MFESVGLPASENKQISRNVRKSLIFEVAVTDDTVNFTEWEINCTWITIFDIKIPHFFEIKIPHFCAGFFIAFQFNNWLSKASQPRLISCQVSSKFPVYHGSATSRDMPA